jgi:hypothetical protein
MREPAKAVVEECLALDVNALIRAGAFRAPVDTPCDIQWRDAAGQLLLTVNFWRESSPAPALRVSYRIGGQGAVSVSHRIELTSVPCHFGGSKHLFRCPGMPARTPCARRAGKLYLVNGRLVCRFCGDLTYVARQQHDRRLDALARSPESLLEALESQNFQKRLLALKAVRTAYQRWTRCANKAKAAT